MGKNVVESSVYVGKLENKDAVESASINVRRLEKGSHEFVINNYSNYKEIGVNKKVESERFTVGGYQWAICFYPNGRNEVASINGDASLFIVLKSNCAAPVRTLYELYLLDQSGGGNNWGYTFFDPDNPLGYIPAHKKRGSMIGRISFINRANLEPSVYLKDDCLKISCTIGVFINHIQDLPIIEISPKPTIWTDFGRLLETKRGADVLFKVDDERFSAHKCILVGRSPVFRPLFSNAHQQEEIRIPNMEPRIFKAMLGFIYTGTLVEEDQESFGDSDAFIFNSFLGKMLAAADQFELKRLKKLCESRILERLSEESVAHLSHLADLYHATELKAACLRFAAENKAAVIESVTASNGSEYLEETCPLLLEIDHDREDFGEKLSTSKEINFCGKIVSVVKGMIGPSNIAEQKKMKMMKKIK